MEQWIRCLLKRQSQSIVLTTAPPSVASGTTGPEHTLSLSSSTSSSSIMSSGDGPDLVVARMSLSSDHPTSLSTSTSTMSVLSGHGYQSTAGHSISNHTVAGIVVGAAIGSALITFLVTFLFMRRERRSRSSRQHHRPLERFLMLRKSTNRQIVPTHSGPSFLENHLPRSAEDITVAQRARTTLEQICFHVETFYRGLSDDGTPNSDDQLAVFDSPYLPTPLVTLLTLSKNKTPLIMHSLAYLVTLSISSINVTEHSLLPIEFITLPSSLSCVESDVLANAGKIQFCAKNAHFIALQSKR